MSRQFVSIFLLFPLFLLPITLTACATGGGSTGANAPASTAATPTPSTAKASSSGAQPPAATSAPPTAAPKAQTAPGAQSPAGTAASPQPSVQPAGGNTPPTPAAQPPAGTEAPKAAGPATVDVSVVATGLDTPWAIGFTPDGRILLTERPGRIRVVKEGQLQPEPWLTLPVAEVGEAGLLGLAVDPQFAQNGYVYTAYTYRGQDSRLYNRLVRLRENRSAGRGEVDQTLLEGVPGNTTHDGGGVAFGPDGKLYWAMGDAQNQPSAQDRAALNGKILRLNPDGSIPADNPLPNSPVWSYGHRNPQGMAWQPGAGRMYATEHGPSGGQGAGQDELNFIEPGQNYGWPTVSGDRRQEGLVNPVIHSGTQETWAPGGATFVTQGPWAGSLLFTGLRGQSLYRVVLDPADPRKVATFERLLQGEYGRLRDVAEGPDGAIYIATSNQDGRGNPARDDDRILRLTVR